MVGEVGGGGQRLRRSRLLFRRPSSAALLQVCDVAVALVVHLPGFAEDPASFDVGCQEIEVEVGQGEIHTD